MTSKEIKSQSNKAKRAEIDFRPFLGESAAADNIYRTMFRERAYRTLVDLKDLERRGITFSPFLEIGAGSVQRSAALANHYPADGAAIDISQGGLQNAPIVLSMLGYDNEPMRICCDAHHLPFLPDSFQFAFAYRTLHHFGNPIPVVAECHRVLGRDAHFFFNEEPMIGPLIRLLRGRRTLSDPPTRLQRLAYRYRLEKVFWDDGALERSVGIVEARYDMDLWRRALKPFAIVDVEVSRRLKIHSDLEKPAVKALLSGLIGGNIKGLCRKVGGEVATADFRNRLMCLDCRGDQLSAAGGGMLQCGNCGREYPSSEGVLRMLPRDLEDGLYQADP